MADMDEVSLMAFEFLFDEKAKLESRRETNVIWQGISVATAQRGEKPKIERYVEDLVPRYSPDDFRSVFRVGRVMCQAISVVIGAQLLMKHPLDGGRKVVPVQKCILIGLYYLACQETIRKIAEKFEVSEYSVITCRNRFMKALISLKEDVIKWPQGKRMEEVIQGFKEKQGLKAVGAIDGSHITIRPPVQSPENYVNRKGSHSIILQAVCDHEMFFTDIYAGWPGSVHDARVFKRSPICQRLEVHHDDMCPQGSFLLGDAAYPAKSYLLTPFKDNGNLTKQQRDYNFKHSSSRMKIEQSFGALKGRWRRLKIVDMVKLEDILDVVMSTCILHNMCLIHEEDLMEFMADEENVNNFQSLPLYQNCVDGIEKRQMVMDTLFKDM